MRKQLRAGLIGTIVCGCGADVADGGGGAGGTITGGAVPDECAEYFPEPPAVPPREVQVVIRNDTATPLYLRETETECSPPPFRVATLEGQALQTSRGSCSFTCDQVANGECGCFLGCGDVPVVFIAPGGAFTTVWPETLYEGVQLPTECFAVDGCDVGCLKPVSARPLNVRAEGYDAVECSAGNCSCTPDASGSCELTGTVVSDAPVAVAYADWSPGDETITLVFE